MEGEAERRLAVARWRGKQHRTAIDFHCSGVKRNVAAVHVAQHDRQTPQALLTKNLVSFAGNLDAR
jgi:hypothetical protein